MTRAVVVLVALALPLAEPGPANLTHVRTGMTANEVLAITGKPVHVSRVVLFRRHLEYWHFDEPKGSIELNCPRGESQTVTSVRISKK